MNTEYILGAYQMQPGEKKIEFPILHDLHKDH